MPHLRRILLVALVTFSSARASTGDAAANTTPPPTAHIVFFIPSDRTVPAGVVPRLTRIAETTEKFFFDEMTRCGYPPAVKSLFPRQPDGSVEVLEVHGDRPAATITSNDQKLNLSIIDQAARQYHIPGDRNVWWIFFYLGDRPARYNDFHGVGNARDGGRSTANYDTAPGEIRPDVSLTAGFNGEFFLRGAVHEFGHALGLFHVGPDLDLGLGNSLMGPTTARYAARNLPHPDRVYLPEPCAAMLWKHPLFSGTAKDRLHQPTVQLLDYHAAFDPADGHVTLTGKLVADVPAHSVVVTDDQGRGHDQYWFRAYSARLAADGTFRVVVDHPSKGDGQYRIVFCFDNGAVTGTGDVAFGLGTAIPKPYHYHDGTFDFGE